jgi:hypothetical protein
MSPLGRYVNKVVVVPVPVAVSYRLSANTMVAPSGDIAADDM